MNPSSMLRACLWLALLPACATVPPPAPDRAPEYDSAPTHPHWAGRPASWSKLADIEEWLRGAGPRQYPEHVPMAEIELAEGRLALAKKDAADLPKPLLASRLGTAESGFRAVLSRAPLAAAHRLRAERGLAEIEALRGAELTAAAPRASAARPASVHAGGLEILARAAWRASAPLGHRLTAAAGGWSRVTIHHSAKYTREIGSPTEANVADAIRDIQTVHMRDRGWGDIGYHFVIDPTGRIWQGRLLDWQGAHAQGSNNVSNIGICLLGDFDHERPDPRALDALERLTDALCERHHIARSRIYGHQKFAPTECPGDALMAWIARYTAGATH